MAHARKILITGASSGLGRGLAGFFARRGERVYAAARREEQLQALRKEHAHGLGEIIPVRLDVSDAEAVVEKLREIDSSSGGLDVVVANAGVSLESDARRIEWTNVQKVIDVNVTGAAATLTAVLPAMVKRNRGQLVAVSSLAGFTPLPSYGAYNASKAFLSMFVESLRMDLIGTGVKLTLIHPGFVKSEMTAQSPFPMPFLLETADAVQRMADAIDRGEAELSFPWQLSAAVRTARLLPSNLRALLSARVKQPGRAWNE